MFLGGTRKRNKIREDINHLKNIYEFRYDWIHQTVQFVNDRGMVMTSVTFELLEDLGL